jgi:hypothetical protein
LDDRVVRGLGLQVRVKRQWPARSTVAARPVLLEPRVAVRDAEGQEDLERCLVERDAEIPRVDVGDARSSPWSSRNGVDSTFVDSSAAIHIRP